MFTNPNRYVIYSFSKPTDIPYPDNKDLTFENAGDIRTVCSSISDVLSRSDRMGTDWAVRDTTTKTWYRSDVFMTLPSVQIACLQAHKELHCKPEPAKQEKKHNDGTPRFAVHYVDKMLSHSIDPYPTTREAITPTNVGNRIIQFFELAAVLSYVTSLNHPNYAVRDCLADMWFTSKEFLALPQVRVIQLTARQDYATDKITQQTMTQEVIMVISDEQDNYTKFRGKCREMSESLVAVDPTLRLVRGHYYCPQWGEQPHWWCVDTNGKIVDPTALQFPSQGNGVYVEFDGHITCEYCGKMTTEDDAYTYEHHVYCSSTCFGRDVGIL